MSLPVLSVEQMRRWEAATWASGVREQEVIAQVGLGLADQLRGDQRLRSLQLCVGVGEPCPGAGFVRLCTGELCGIGPGIDDEQRLSLRDQIAILELDGLDRAPDAGSHIDRLESLEATGVIIPVGDLLQERLRNDDSGRRRRRGCGFVTASAQQRQYSRQQSCRCSHRAPDLTPS